MRSVSARRHNCPKHEDTAWVMLLCIHRLLQRKGSELYQGIVGPLDTEMPVTVALDVDSSILTSALLLDAMSQILLIDLALAWWVDLRRRCRR
jgi:hypothetical protein